MASTDRLGDLPTITPDPGEATEPPIPQVKVDFPKIIRVRETRPSKWNAQRIQLRAGQDPKLILNQVVARSSAFVRMRGGTAGVVAWVSPNFDKSTVRAVPLDAPDGSFTLKASSEAWAWCEGGDCELVIVADFDPEAES